MAVHAGFSVGRLIAKPGRDSRHFLVLGTHLQQSLRNRQELVVVHDRLPEVFNQPLGFHGLGAHVVDHLHDLRRA